jgi:peroxiredoxin
MSLTKEGMMRNVLRMSIGAALVCGMQLAHADFAPSAETAHPLAVGAPAPEFVAYHADHSKYVFEPNHLSRPVVIIFYRGGWCPFCNAQLADLHEVEPRLVKSGFEVIFVSSDRPALLYASLKDETRRKSLTYTLLSDPELRAAQAFGIAFHLDDKAYAQQLSYGVDLEKTTGTKAHALPVPSVFVVDRAGIIRFEYSNPDFRVRLSADELWKAASGLQ